MTLPQIPVGWEGGHPLSNSHSSWRLQHLNIGDFSTSCYWTTSNFCSAYVPALLGWSNSQVRPLQRWKTATMPSRLQSRNRPIFLFLSLSNFELKPFTDFADTVSWSSMFQRLTTLSEKKWRRTSQLQRCLTSLNEWPRMTTCSIVSVQFTEFGQWYWWDSLPFSKLWWDLNNFFFLQESTDLVYLGVPCMCNCWLLSLANLAYYRIVTYSHKMPRCALLIAIKNYNKSLEKLQ